VTWIVYKLQHVRQFTYNAMIAQMVNRWVVQVTPGLTFSVMTHLVNMWKAIQGSSETGNYQLELVKDANSSRLYRFLHMVVHDPVDDFLGEPTPPRKKMKPWYYYITTTITTFYISLAPPSLSLRTVVTDTWTYFKINTAKSGSEAERNPSNKYYHTSKSVSHHYQEMVPKNNHIR
jgi:hypothetical protein